MELIISLFIGLLGFLGYAFYDLVWRRMDLPQKEKAIRRKLERAFILETIEKDRAAEDLQRASLQVNNHGKNVDHQADTIRRSSTATDEKRREALILSLSEVDEDDIEFVGGKGAGLGHLAKKGIPVPAGFCITARAFKLATCGDSTQRNSVLNAVRASYANLKGGDCIVAVRSSATCEDNAAASYAGQLESFLGISGHENVIESVIKCWDSLCADRVKSYHGIVSGFETRGIACCVVVQEMVDASVAGVMFTANPLNNSRNESVVSASWGLGESVVSDTVRPDTWIVDTPLMKILSADISSEKTTKYTICRESGTKLVTVDEWQARAPCLEDSQVLELVKLGSIIHSLFGNARDIEWAIDKNDSRIIFLQARPITTLNSVKDDSDEPSLNEFDSKIREEDWITTCNAAEMFPGAGTPLSISVFGRAANYAIQAMHCSFGVRDKINESEAVVAWFYGNQFLNMTSTLRVMCGGMIGSSMAKENGEMSILGRFNNECSLKDILKANNGISYSLPYRLLNGLRYVTTSATAIIIRMPRCRKRVLTARQLLAPVDNEKAEGLWERLDENQSDYLDSWSDGVTISSTSAAFALLLMKLLCVGSPFKPWSTEAVARVSALLQSSKTENMAESCNLVHALDALVNEIVSNAEDVKALKELKNDQEALNYLKFERKSNTFSRFLEVHGHRCVKESELRAVEWARDPLPLVQLIQRSVSRQADTKKQDFSLKSASQKITVQDALSHAHKPLQKTLIKVVAFLARIASRGRELGKTINVEHHTELKRGYTRLGELLHSEGRIPDADLVFFFTHVELGMVSTGNAPQTTISRLTQKAIKRRGILRIQESLEFKNLQKGVPVPEHQQGSGIKRDDKGHPMAQGTPVCTGDVIGYARVVRTIEAALNVVPGEIVICPQTDVGWTPFFSVASGLVTQIGGLLSHGAVVAREYGLPCVVNVRNACNIFETGQLIHLEGSTGIVRAISNKSQPNPTK